jgi:hypothetical protein
MALRACPAGRGFVECGVDISAPCQEVFHVIHDYEIRLRWDVFRTCLFSSYITDYVPAIMNRKLPPAGTIEYWDRSNDWDYSTTARSICRSITDCFIVNSPDRAPHLSQSEYPPR